MGKEKKICKLKMVHLGIFKKLFFSVVFFFFSRLSNVIGDFVTRT